jgi:hypothetical protein
MSKAIWWKGVLRFTRYDKDKIPCFICINFLKVEDNPPDHNKPGEDGNIDNTGKIV